MSLIVDKSEFAEQLAAVSSVVKGKVAHPVLNYVKLEALKSETEDAVFLTGSDLDSFYRRSIEAQVATEFSCLLPVRSVREWLAGVGPGKLTIATKNQKVGLKIGQNKIEIATMADKDFPAFPPVNGPSIACADLAPLTAVMSAAPDSDARLELFDIPISYVSSNKLMACAANGVVLATHVFNGLIEAGHTLHLTPPTVSHVSRLGVCQIADGPNFITFQGDGFIFHAKKLAAKTIEFTKILKDWDFVAHATLIREEFMEAIASCHVLRGTDENAFVAIEAEEGGLKISCRNKLGDFDSSIAARVEGEFNPVTLPTSQLLNPLRSSEEETVGFSVTNPVNQTKLSLGATTFFIVCCREIPAKK